MRFDVAERVADAVLFEGYVLYPYRATATKNQLRWQFGVVAPMSQREDGEPSCARTECLIEAAEEASPRLWIRVRCLRPRQTSVEIDPPPRPWLEGVPCVVDAVDGLSLEPPRVECVRTLGETEIDARLTLDARRRGRFVKLTVLLENLESWRAEFDASRDAMLERSLVGAHLLLAVEGGTFVSLVEPPEEASALVADCQNRHTWPVLLGDRARPAVMLSSPIVLYDFPAVAQESPGDLFDAAEIDEILSLRILTMTDEEKREARATDARARAILDRVDALTPEAWGALHGAIRNADFFNPRSTPPPESASVMIAGQRVAKGSHVRLRPNRRADAMDMFLEHQPATVAGVYRDVDDRVHVAVTVDADPAASMHESFGRYFYFDPEEIELMTEDMP